MKSIIVLVFSLGVLGCSQGDKPADNVATRYTKSLQNNLEKSQAAADKANKAIAESTQRVNEAMEMQ